MVIDSFLNNFGINMYDPSYFDRSYYLVKAYQARIMT